MAAQQEQLKEVPEVPEEVPVARQEGTGRPPLLRRRRGQQRTTVSATTPAAGSAMPAARSPPWSRGMVSRTYMASEGMRNVGGAGLRTLTGGTDILGWICLYFKTG